MNNAANNEIDPQALVAALSSNPQLMQAFLAALQQNQHHANGNGPQHMPNLANAQNPRVVAGSAQHGQQRQHAPGSRAAPPPAPVPMPSQVYPVPPVPPQSNSINILELFQLFSLFQASIIQNQISQHINAGIDISRDRDKAVANCLREAKSRGSSYQAAIENMSTTHGYSAPFWKEHFINRLDTILPLVIKDGAPPSPRSQTVKKPAFPPRAHSRVSPSRQIDTYHVKSERAPKRSHRGERKTSSESDDCYDSDYRGRPGPSHHARGKTPYRSQNMSGGSTVPSGDKKRVYLFTDEMGSSGSRFTSGDLDAMACRVACFERRQWEQMSTNQQWASFGVKHSQRTVKAWIESYRNWREEVDTRAKYIRKRRRHSETNDDADPRHGHGNNRRSLHESSSNNYREETMADSDDLENDLHD